MDKLVDTIQDFIKGLWYNTEYYLKRIYNNSDNPLANIFLSLARFCSEKPQEIHRCCYCSDAQVEDEVSADVVSLERVREIMQKIPADKLFD